jgi:predicted HAD superfamily Cof-like phosphohydrolase
LNQDNHRYYNQVKTFHKAFSQPAPDSPTRLSEIRKASRIKWMQEELDEYKASNTIYDDADGLIDLIYFAIGTLVEQGIEPDNIFDIVNKANMSKLWEDGLPRFNEIGKIIKPPTWIAPETLIEQEINRQINQ